MTTTEPLIGPLFKLMPGGKIMVFLDRAASTANARCIEARRQQAGLKHLGTPEEEPALDAEDEDPWSSVATIEACPPTNRCWSGVEDMDRCVLSRGHYRDSLHKNPSPHRSVSGRTWF